LAITEVSICNSALSKIGAERINSLSDNTAAGRLAREQYAKTRDSLLMEHPWKFCVGRKELGLAVYVPVYEYEKAFQLPPDLLRIIDTDLTEFPSIGETPWDTEIDPDTQLRYLVTNADSVKIKYIKMVGEAFFTPLFAEILAWRLAAEWAYALTQNASLAALFDTKYKEKIREARSFSAMEASPKVVEADDWFLSRF
jgi:hypothetical protein